MSISTSSTPLHKAYGVTNIKSHVPLLLNLDELNYDAWCELFTSHCIGFDVIDHIDDTYDPNATDPIKAPPTDSEWKKLDSIVKNWIYGTITQSLLQNIIKRNTTARQAWLSLENHFRVNKDAKVIQLQNELCTIKLGNMKIDEYCTKIKIIADLLENIDAKVAENTLVAYTLNGLPCKWENVAMNLRLRKKLPTWLETRAYLLGEEPRLISSHITENSSSSTVLHTSQPSGQNRNRNNGRRNDRRQPQQPSLGVC
ncbi:uncharacterized protein [Rutidosis leptorrhynchoides]|uniref:uncharacterized protein n=1 Tax=Rutidosis leptorrhynchoides TaxID=125765 RepID=UPI003A997C67